MAGYFSNNGEGTDANAARQFEREFADNPRSFGGPGGGFLGRLIGARQPSNRITSEPLPDLTPAPEAPASLASAPALVNRILAASRPPMPPQWSQGAPPAQNGPPMQLPQQNLPNAAPQGPPDLRQQMAVPFQGAGMPGQGMNMGPGGLGSPVQLPMDGMMPPMPQQPPPPPPMMPRGPMPTPPPSQVPYGYKGQLQAQSAMPQGMPARGMPMPQGPRGAGLPPYPQQPGAGVPAGGLTPQMAMDLVNYVKELQANGGQPRAFANGGYLRMMRGGYPADLMMGMPMRHDYARGSYVSEDGQGDGRSDHVDAKLSPGEFVVDAESVSMLGNGSNEAGARKLEQMRSGIRRQKGKALAKGKFSPDAKSPEAYMRGKTRGKS